VRQRKESRPQTQKGDKVSFRIADIFLPDTPELRSLWQQAGELEGRIVDFSDSGNASQIYAVVEVLWKQSVVVPVANLTTRAE